MSSVQEHKTCAPAPLSGLARAVTINRDNMAEFFLLFWLREAGCDAGTRVRADELEPEIRERVLELARDSSAEITLRLPFLDRAEWRRRGEILKDLSLERVDDVISASLSPMTAARDFAASLVLRDPAWTNTPDERDPLYFSVWQKVSLALQHSLRSWVAEEYFRDTARYQDRDSAYPMLVYASTRLCYGRPRTEFTYDLRDYPDRRDTLAETWKMTGRSLQDRMAAIEILLREAGLPALARRYKPVWYQDVMAAVRKRPRHFVALLAAESAVINALINMGSERNVAAINRFAKRANRSLRSVYGMDLRKLAVRMLEEATRVLRTQQASGGADHVLDGGFFKSHDVQSAGSPDPCVGGQKDGHDGCPDGGGEVSDAGIVSDIEAGGRDPAGQLV
jgi:hypothetical protein